MSKHYRRRQVPPPRTGVFRALVMVCVSFFSGYLTASYFDMNHFGAWLVSLRPQTSQLVPVPQMATHKPKPKLEFYTLLTTNRAPASPPAPARAAPVVAVNKSDAGVSNMSRQPTVAIDPRAKPVKAAIVRQMAQDAGGVTSASAPAAPASMKQAYTIQVAAFRAKEDAEHMKASLLLRGFPVNISSVGANGVTWFRVMVGPFTSRVQAEATQSVLIRRERMNGMIRKMDA